MYRIQTESKYQTVVRYVDYQGEDEEEQYTQNKVSIQKLLLAANRQGWKH